MVDETLKAVMQVAKAISDYESTANNEEEVAFWRTVYTALKAQEARVIPIEQVLSYDVAYAEDIDKDEIIPVLVGSRMNDRIALVRGHLGDSQSHKIYPRIAEYGRRWRLWTQRPSDELRKAAWWDG